VVPLVLVEGLILARSELVLQALVAAPLEEQQAEVAEVAQEAAVVVEEVAAAPTGVEERQRQVAA